MGYGAISATAARGKDASTVKSRTSRKFYVQGSWRNKAMKPVYALIALAGLGVIGVTVLAAIQQPVPDILGYVITTTLGAAGGATHTAISKISEG